MQEDVLEVLLYLFDHFQDEEHPAPPSEEALAEMLEQAGFGRGESLQALQWLDDLSLRREEAFEAGPLADMALRVYTEPECARLSPECRGFILFLEQMGVLTGFSRELVIDRVMALPSPDEVDVDQLKWIVLMTLYGLAGHEGAYAWVENMDAQVYLH